MTVMPIRTLLVILLLVGCARPSPQPVPLPPAPTGPLHLASPAFEDGAPIPRKHTCDGAAAERGTDAASDASSEGASPPLVISGAPANASTIALEVLDPDVPTPIAPQSTFVHWLAWNAPLVNGTAAFAEGAVPNGTVQGENGDNAAKYAPPCPPLGSPAHRYVFTAFAVDGALRLDAGATREQLDAALAGHVVAQARLVGTYARALPIT